MLVFKTQMNGLDTVHLHTTVGAIIGAIAGGGRGAAIGAGSVYVEAREHR